MEQPVPTTKNLGMYFRFISYGITEKYIGTRGLKTLHHKSPKPLKMIVLLFRPDDSSSPSFRRRRTRHRRRRRSRPTPRATATLAIRVGLMRSAGRHHKGQLLH